MNNQQQQQKDPELIKIEMSLLSVPSLSSEWIEDAAYLMHNYNLPLDDLLQYSSDQLNMIKSVFTSAESNEEIDTNLFLNSNLNSTQMQILLTGYSHGLKTNQLEKYFDAYIPYAKLNWAISALLNGHDLYDYIKKGYGIDQLYEIYAATQDGVDYTLYDDINNTPEIMTICRHSLYLGLNIEFDKNNKLTIY